MKKIKISVAILTFNEEENIVDCLESVKWADEIVLVDEGSSDKTVELAKKYTNNIKIVDHDPDSKSSESKAADPSGHETMFHKNKQKSIDFCKGDWILQIDADERVTSKLKDAVLSVVNSDQFSGYQVARKNIIFNKWLEHTGWYPDYQVKLFKRGKGWYPCKTVHELVEIDGEIGTLQGDLLHEHYKSVFQFIDRLNKYTTNDANFLIAKDESVVWYHALAYPLEEFVKRYFFWQGYKDGIHGLALSLLQAFSRLVVFAKVWEHQKFFEKNISLNEWNKEVGLLARNYRYWYKSAKIDMAQSKAKKLVYKLQRKFDL